MTEQANLQTLRDRATQINDQVKSRVDQVNQEARELYGKAETRINDLLKEYKSIDTAVDTFKSNSNKLQQNARDFQSQQKERLENLGNQLVELLGLSTTADLESLEKKVKTLTNKVKKLEKAAKAK